MPSDPFYKTLNWQKMKSKIFARDNYTCRMCGANVRGKGLGIVDHVKRRKTHPELALEPSNLQTLCKACHDSVKQRDEHNPNRGARADGLPPDGSWD